MYEEAEKAIDQMIKVARCKTALEALVLYGAIRSEWRRVRKILLGNRLLEED